MHGTLDKRARKAKPAKALRARRVAKSAPVQASADQPLTLKISARLNRALTKLEAKSGKAKTYHVRRALERYVEDTWDYLVAVEASKNVKRTYSLEEVKKRLGMGR
jgi:RHH-type rel operon transcriptional repressor/antitoxin RelB